MLTYFQLGLLNASAWDLMKKAHDPDLVEFDDHMTQWESTLYDDCMRGGEQAREEYFAGWFNFLKGVI